MWQKLASAESKFRKDLGAENATSAIRIYNYRKFAAQTQALNFSYFSKIQWDIIVQNHLLLRFHDIVKTNRNGYNIVRYFGLDEIVGFTLIKYAK